MNVQIANATLDSIQALERAPSILKVKEAFRQTADRHGFSAYLCSAPPSGRDQQADPILFEEWPSDWRRTYFGRRLYVHDPMLKELFRTADPFLWSETMERRDFAKAERAVMWEAAQAKMTEGYVVPIYGVGGAVHVLTMTGEKPRVDIVARAELHLIAIYAYARAKQLRRRSGGNPVSLRPREREVLRWAAAGKSDWEIGEIIGVSESAAHKHIESAKRKWRVSTRVQAIVEAIRQGEIPL
jgi:LuxR family quorum sensing-dependent transcriptional regulator